MSKEREIVGAFPTMITPFKEDGSVDYETVKKYVYWYHDNGCKGIFAICQSSEIFYLSLEERVKLNRTVYQRAKELDPNFLVVSSGHVSDALEDQAKERREAMGNIQLSDEDVPFMQYDITKAHFPLDSLENELGLMIVRSLADTKTGNVLDADIDALADEWLRKLEFNLYEG